MSRKLTIQEQRMINEIERRLEDYNSLSNFSDTNMVAKTIERIETQQLLKCSYTNSNFLFFLFMIFASKVDFSLNYIADNRISFHHYSLLHFNIF